MTPPARQRAKLAMPAPIFPHHGATMNIRIPTAGLAICLLAACATQPKPLQGQFQTLTHPEHLGHRFRVLIQGRNP